MFHNGITDEVIWGSSGDHRIKDIEEGQRLIKSKREYEKKRKRCFQESWKQEFDGLIDTDEGMICTICRLYPDTAGMSSFITGNKVYRIDGVRAHFASRKHILCSEIFHREQAEYGM